MSKETSLRTLMPFCRLQEGHIPLSPLHVEYREERYSGPKSHAPCLAKRRQGSSVLLRLASSEWTKCFEALGRQIPWQDGLDILVLKIIDSSKNIRGGDEEKLLISELAMLTEVIRRSLFF